MDDYDKYNYMHMTSRIETKKKPSKKDAYNWEKIKKAIKKAFANDIRNELSLDDFMSLVRKELEGKEE